MNDDNYKLDLRGSVAYFEDGMGDVVMRVQKDGYYIDVETFDGAATLTLAEFARLARWVNQ